jgi:hypothetical protein
MYENPWKGRQVSERGLSKVLALKGVPNVLRIAEAVKDHSLYWGPAPVNQSGRLGVVSVWVKEGSRLQGGILGP